MQKQFKPKAHILRLLGNELIKNPIMAIYELVKNSYDADSKSVDVNFKNIENIEEIKKAITTIKNIENIEESIVTIENIGNIEKAIENIKETIENIEEVKKAILTIKNLEEAVITIEDNGIGLTKEILEDVWLEPGTDHRKPIDKHGNHIIKKSLLYERVPMGEKGVGRFAVHKLGDKIKLITRPANIITNEENIKSKKILDYEITLEIDWNSFSQDKYLDDVLITWKIETDISKFYFKNNSGTSIEISGLKEPWTRKMARSLKRNSLSMLSPKNDEEKFRISLNFQNNWLDEFPDAKDILELAPYKYTALLDKDYNLTVDYSFSLKLNDEFGTRKIENETENIRGLLIPKLREELEEELLSEDEIDEKIEEFKLLSNPFGDILLEIYSYDLDSVTLKNYTYDAQSLKQVLKQHSGIRVFKDNMRVYNYGEPGDDWLELDIKRVQSKEWFSNNQNIGFIYLDSASSTGLIEKTNREGFIDNNTFKLFYNSVLSILNEFKSERSRDRNKWLHYLKPTTKSFPKNDQFSLFNDLIDSTDLSNDEQKQLLKDEAEKLQKDFDEKKETMLIPAGVGMTASVALHEIEKLVPIMREVVNSYPFKVNIANEKIDELKGYLDGILSVLRKGGNKPIDVKESLNKAISNYSSKLNRRNVKLELNHDESITTIKCDKRYFITMIMNIIENSIYWLDTIYKEDKGLYIKTIIEDNNVSIIIADNGPGFKDEIVDVVRPFFSRKDDGIGIGLYLVDTIMMKYGKLEIIHSEEELSEIGIPSQYRGATLKLKFTRGQ